MAEYLPIIVIGAVMVAVTIAYNWVKNRSSKDKEKVG